jgi:hypothetical protein
MNAYNSRIYAITLGIALLLLGFRMTEGRQIGDYSSLRSLNDMLARDMLLDEVHDMHPRRFPYSHPKRSDYVYIDDYTTTDEPENENENNEQKLKEEQAKLRKLKKLIKDQGKFWNTFGRRR